ncbi:MAG: ribonuclease HII [Alphaproteobacteria bacterium]|nr:ribonuclease HII [Alphaproteobacteria bacterium]
MPDLSLEQSHARPVAGVDEAGRGPWAGPVVAAAVILDRAAIPDGIDDSKCVAPARREALFARLLADHAVGIGEATVAEIDRLNIRAATLLAMTRAVAALPWSPAFVLVDGDVLPKLPCPGRSVVGGDRRSLSVAAASIVAKVHRDRLMAGLAVRFPGYGWERNKGYGTALHQAALERLGVTEQHRHSFRPVALVARRGETVN